MNYAELQVTSNFSFLRGASHPHELVVAAQALGMTAIGIADRGSMAGAVRMHVACKQAGLRLVVGCRLDLDDGLPLLVYPTDRAAYARLSQLLSFGKSRAGKGGCSLDYADVRAASDGLIAVLVPDRPDARLGLELTRLKRDFGDRAYVALTRRFRPGERARLAAIVDRAHGARVMPVVTNDVLYHVPERRMLQDVATCIREGCAIDDAGFRRERFADRFLKPPAEMVRLFADYPQAIEASTEIAERCRFSLDDLAYQYPEEAPIPGLNAQEALERFTWEGAARRYPDGVSETVRAQLRKELDLIAQMRYAPYFLTVARIVRAARAMDILCQGRGSAANSAVCFMLDITEIDPTKSNLLFERFISTARNEPPDIDVDFEHERREEVIQWIYETYGRDRSALAATVITYRAKGAIRDVGKAMGLPQDVTAALSKQAWAWSKEGVSGEQAQSLGFDAGDRRLAMTLDLARELIGFPRHLSQHPGGFVLTREPLADLVPVEPAAMENRQVVEWDKDDLDALKIMKVDVLGLGMLGCLRRAFTMLEDVHGWELAVATIPPEDKDTYRMICRADTVGVFQIESRAQMSMLPRLRPKEFYDLVIEVAIVRPGPIQGNMVHPYLKRRQDPKLVTYPKPELEAVLKKTLGVPLFQEQAMRIAIECAGFTPDEADGLRRSMATFRFDGKVESYEEQFLKGMARNGYPEDFAINCFNQIKGFGSYGFPESHAASFAILVYASSWIKCHYPAIFCCAILNAQPMGFYQPAQLIRDAREHGVEVLPVDVNVSRWDSTIEGGPKRQAVRLGLRLVKGLSVHEAERLTSCRYQPYPSIEALHRRSGLKVASLEKLADANAFVGMGIDRRRALWDVRALADSVLPLFAHAARIGGANIDGGGIEIMEPPAELPVMPAGRHVVEDYAATGFSLRAHPVSFLRHRLESRGAMPFGHLADPVKARDGKRVRLGGLILVRQRPGSGEGVVFITLEDETGIANLVVWPDLFEKQRRLILAATMLGCIGRVQREGIVVHVVVEELIDLSHLLRQVAREEAAPDTVPDATPSMPKSRDLYTRDIRVTHGIKVPTRDFR
ncbi:MAG TPA: error-prone DNA polymerase [Stellaceae bacterium]|nr:error-prone DNA polymerase [Stellaceae bacterium]